MLGAMSLDELVSCKIFFFIFYFLLALVMLAAHPRTAVISHD